MATQTDVGLLVIQHPISSSFANQQVYIPKLKVVSQWCRPPEITIQHYAIGVPITLSPGGSSVLVASSEPAVESKSPSPTCNCASSCLVCKEAEVGDVVLAPHPAH